MGRLIVLLMASCASHVLQTHARRGCIVDVVIRVIVASHAVAIAHTCERYRVTEIAVVSDRQLMRGEQWTSGPLRIRGNPGSVCVTVMPEELTQRDQQRQTQYENE